MNWFENTRRQIRALARKAYRDERRRLPLVLAQVSEQASQEGLGASSQNLTDLLKRSIGSRDPEFARGLNSLAILAMARGELEEAESLFVRALTIRKGMLGPFHPETIDTKERLDALRQIMEVSNDSPFAVIEPPLDAPPTETPAEVYEVADQSGYDDEPLGPIQNQESFLEAETFELANAAGLRTLEPTPTIEPAPPPVLPPSPSTPPIVKIHSGEGFHPVPIAGRVTEGIAEEIAELSEAFNTLAARMSEAAARISERGEIPSDDLVEEMEAARREFQRRRSRLRQSASDLRFSPRPDEELASLADLSRWLDAMVESERRDSETRQIRAKAIESLSRFLSLAHVSDPEFAALRQSQANAAAVRESIARAKSLDTLDEARNLADGHHPINDILILASRRRILDDAEWSELHASVAKSLGGELAAAAARGRLKSLPASNFNVAQNGRMFNGSPTSNAS